MNRRAIKYSNAELSWIEARATANRRDTHSDFQKLFGRDDVSLQNFNALCKRNGWLTGRTGRFPKGNTPPNKGKKMPFNANVARTQFKKGVRTGRANELYKPIGTERLSNEGYLERKIHDGMPLQSRWRAVHLIRWEAIHGPVPDGMCLKCLDGNRQNTDPENWEPISRSLLPYLNGNRGLNYELAEPEVKPVILTIAKVKGRVRKLSQDEKAGPQ